MMKKLQEYILIGVVLTSLSLLVPSFVFAQSRTLSGVVTSKEDGLPIPGVNVLVKGTSVGTATDQDGKFSLAVSDANLILF